MSLKNQIDLVALRRRVEHELAEYVYEVPDEAVGNPMAEDHVAEYLRQMKAALINPYLVQVEVRDTYAQIGYSAPELRTCAIVAKDDTQSPMLAYDFVAEEFVLVERTGNAAIRSIGVRGDAVGCFLAR
jgi:hypothetical protein